MSDDAALQQQKRQLIPYLDRAREVEKVHPKVAYYCRLHALEQVIPRGSSLHPAIAAFVKPLMTELAKVKPTLELDRANDAKLCEAFARRVFATADSLDRSGRADAVTKRTFVYADQYFKVLSQFGALPPAALKLQKYAQWRAVEIAKALREGRTPDPPPILDTAVSPGEEDELMAMLNSMPDAPSGSGAAPEPRAAAPPPTHQPEDYTPPPPAPPPAAAAAAPAEAPPRQFHPGQCVLYCADSNAHAIKREGAVQQVGVASSGDLVYKVSLADGSQVTASGDKLAPAMCAGTAVLFYPPGGGPAEEAEVEEAYASRWPPTYLVNVKRRGLVETDDDRLVALPAAALPAVEAAPPPPPPPGFAIGQAEPEAAAAAGTSSGQQPSAESAVHSGQADYCAAAGAGAGGAGAQRIASDELSAIAEEASEALTPAVTDGAAAFPPFIAPAGAPPAAAPTPAPPLPPSPPPPQQQPAAFYPLPPSASPPPPLAAAPAGAYAAAAPPQPRPQPQSHPIPQAVAESVYTDDLAAIMEAQKLTKTAGSAISFEDVPTAVRYLNQALSLLTRGAQGKGK